jgi:hypothetical protein
MEATAFMRLPIRKTVELNFPPFALPADAIGEARRHAG